MFASGYVNTTNSLTLKTFEDDELLKDSKGVTDS